MENESHSFTISSAKLEYVSSKEQYGSIVYYFVVDHPRTKQEMNNIIETMQDKKLPMFRSDTDDVIVKVKERFIGNGTNDMILKQKYKCNLHFEYYTYNDSNGFYLKMDGVQSTSYNTSPEKRKIINITS